MSKLCIDAGETDHYAVHADDAGATPMPGHDIVMLFNRFADADIPAFVCNSEAVDWCFCAQCTRLSIMASLRLAEHEGREDAADRCRRILAGVPL